MNYQELNQKLGGGWVHKSAKVDELAFIGESAIVWGKVSGNAQVSGKRASLRTALCLE